VSNGLDFRILGPLEANDGNQTLRLGGAKQRSVLAILLLHAGEVVSIDLLIEELWADDPPDDAQTALHQHVSRLRKLLEPHRVIETRAPGYVVDAANGALDLHRAPPAATATARTARDVAVTALVAGSIRTTAKSGVTAHTAVALTAT
jgi:DNA-binding SARP family transcriptional activator